MIYFSPAQTKAEHIVLPILAALQILEPKVSFFSTRRGVTTSIFVKLALGYILVGSTALGTSVYFLVFLLPVVTAATAFGPLGTIVFTLITSATYLSFLLQFDWSLYTIEPNDMGLLYLQLIFIALVGFLTHRLAAASRAEEKKYLAAASQLKEAEAAIRRSERLAAIGQLTAGLAHELRNPLGTIRASAEMLEKNLPEGNDLAREMTGFISSEVVRTNSLITRFLEFARPSPLKLKKTELSEVVDRAIGQLEQMRQNTRVTIYTNYSPDIRPFPIDSEILERVVYNLLLNAVQATQAGGAVTVKTREVDGFAEIAVIDRGAGIAAAQIENIFNPFFTTKPDGVGLGLAIVSKLVDEHGGTIAVESERGKGSIFIVRLPMSEL
jgi:signal transduction histidine kinase